ncbi:hypothetical protein AYO44_03820 [Planctomycetaceae bacterium SCGC AG-212-F19]|nr:hypothetical protein AYO44_03820 [Planctomycetaceae bacterium SCGC AG-212-F19]
MICELLWAFLRQNAGGKMPMRERASFMPAGTSEPPVDEETDNREAERAEAAALRAAEMANRGMEQNRKGR